MFVLFIRYTVESIKFLRANFWGFWCFAYSCGCHFLDSSGFMQFQKVPEMLGETLSKIIFFEDVNSLGRVPKNTNKIEQPRVLMIPHYPKIYTCIGLLDNNYCYVKEISDFKFLTMKNKNDWHTHKKTQKT